MGAAIESTEVEMKLTNASQHEADHNASDDDQSGSFPETVFRPANCKGNEQDNEHCDPPII